MDNFGVGRQGNNAGAEASPVFCPAGPAIFVELVRQLGADWSAKVCMGADAEQRILLLSAITQAISIASGSPVAQVQAQVLDCLARQGTLTAQFSPVLPY